jgi:predicted transposase YbfD/YdcC
MAQEIRFNRRVVGMLKARLPDLKLECVADPRSARGRRWALATLLRTVLIGVVAGCKSLADVELLTANLSATTRRQLGIRRRVPDTTLRSLLCRLRPECLRPIIRSLVRAAHRRKALAPHGWPFGVVAMDGKATGLHGADDPRYAPRHVFDGSGRPIGMMRTLTCALVSSVSKVVIDAVPFATTAEAVAFKEAFLSLIRAYGKSNLFRLVTYDAGACSAENAQLVTSHGYDYLFAFKQGQKALTRETRPLLAGLTADHAVAVTEDVLGGGRRIIRRLFLTEEMAGFRWPSLKTVLRVESETFDAKGHRTARENRYFASSLARRELSDAQWLALVRLHWNVENNCHGCLDVSFEEDDRPWIEVDAQGALAMALLRRVAFNLLSIFRSVTQRSEERRSTPWKRLMHSVWLALVTLTEPEVVGLRPRRLQAPS